MAEATKTTAFAHKLEVFDGTEKVGMIIYVTNRDFEPIETGYDVRPKESNLKRLTKAFIGIADKHPSRFWTEEDYQRYIAYYKGDRRKDMVSAFEGQGFTFE